MLQKDDVIRIGFWTLMASPIWLPLIGFWLSVRVAGRIRRWLGMTTLATFILACASASDRNRAQWPTMFIFMACLVLYFGGVLLTWVVRLRGSLQARWRRSAE